MGTWVNGRNKAEGHCWISAGVLLATFLLSGDWFSSPICFAQEASETRCKIIKYEHPGTVETRGKFKAGEKPTAFLEFSAPPGTKYPIVLSFVVGERKGGKLVRYAEGTGIAPLRGKEKSHEIECKDITIHPMLADKKGFVFVLFINSEEYPAVEYKIPKL